MAAAKAFKIGDVVRLKGGTVDMTVTGLYEPSVGEARVMVGCSWHSGKKPEHGRYPAEALELVNVSQKK